MVKKVKRILTKGFKYLKKYGVFATAKKVIKTLYFRFICRNKTKQLKHLQSIVDLSKYKTVIVFENNFGWGKIMKQRPQQMAQGFADDTLVFYHSHEESDFEKGKRIRLIKPNLVVIDLGYFRDIVLQFLVDHYNKYLMVYSTDFIPYERIVEYEKYNYKVIYEYVDDLNEDLSGEVYAELFDRHKKMLNDKNVYVVATATKLKNKITESSERSVSLITNGVDYDHFKYDKYDVPADLQKIVSSYKTVLCYYGALAMWFDYELVKKLAQNKDYAIVLIGQDYDDTLKKSGILQEENVFFLGRKAYEELPKYACNVDICIIPFAINEITEATSPVKLFEYMAMEKPIVTTALPECKKYKSVFYSESHESFISNVEKAAAKVNDEEYKALERKEALENTWSSKAQEMVSFVNEQRTGGFFKKINSILSQRDFSRIVIWRSSFGWDVPLFQRPQHIARQLAKKDCLVFYEVSPKTDHVLSMQEIEPNLFLVNYENTEISCLLEESLAKQDKPAYIQIYSTNWNMSKKEMEGYISRGFNVLYEYIDDISPELAGTDTLPEAILEKYEYVMKNVQVPVVTTANKIYDDVVSKRGKENVAFACNGVDYEFFKDFSKEIEFDEQFLNIVNNGKINVCYYGALAKWFDYELIRKINKQNKYNIILIGIEYDDSFAQSKIGQLENVYFIGPKEYKQLKYYAQKMDVLTIPFVINSITQATSPLKLFEYMALNKPIVTTAMQECKKYQSVMAANDHDEFIAFLEKAAMAKNDKEYMALLDKEARENDWSHKADIIIDLLKQNEQK